MIKGTITCDAKALTSACALFSRIVERGGGAIPILANVALAASDGTLVITGTDMENFLSVRLQATGSIATTVPLKSLAAALKGAPKNAVATISVSGEAVSLSLNNRPGASTMPALPIDDMPPEPELKISNAAFSAPCAEIAELIRRVGFAISSEETRYYLNGIYLQSHKSNLRAVATDGHRLAIWDAPIRLRGVKLQPVIVPRRTIQFLEAASRSDAIISVVQAATRKKAPPQLRFAGDGWTLTAKPIDGTFPDYTKAIPSSTDHALTLKCSALLAAVAASPKSSGGALALEARADGKMLKVSTNSVELGGWEVEIPCSQNGKHKRAGFNRAYMLDALRALGSADDAAFTYTDATSAFRLGDPKQPLHQILLMPMRAW